MKKTFVVLCAIIFVSSLYFMQQATAGNTKTFTGKVAAVHLADLKTGQQSEIIAVDTKGQRMTFAVASNTTISTKTGKKLELGDLKADIDKNKKVIEVVVEYSTDQKNNNKATLVRLTG